MDLPQNIEIRLDVKMGKPCPKGTRIPVYPQLAMAHITAAF